MQTPTASKSRQPVRELTLTDVSNSMSRIPARVSPGGSFQKNLMRTQNALLARRAMTLFGKNRALGITASGIIGLALLAVVSTCYAAQDRPFRGSGQGILTFTSETTAVADWTGDATYLGAFTRKEYLTIGAGGAISGDIIFTAANGDEIYVAFQGNFISAHDATGVYMITGGTGRFMEASGEAAFYASTPDFVNATVTFEGTICF